MSHQPIETVTKSLGYKRFRAGVMTTISFVNLSQNLTAFFRRDAMLKRPCDTAMVQLSIDN